MIFHRLVNKFPKSVSFFILTGWPEAVVYNNYSWALISSEFEVGPLCEVRTQ